MQINIDIETYSDIDIKASGLYKYADSPQFEVLLFAYSIDGAEPVCVDLAQGYAIPEAIIKSLLDPTITKKAFNATFEWYCLSQHFIKKGYIPTGQTLPLKGWICTSIQSLYCGLPGSLDGVTKALKLPADKLKKSTGKTLIKYFCCPVKPTRVNGGRTRNLHHHAPEKWELFKEYCTQDVVAEMAADLALCNFRPPAWIQEEWIIDTYINLRGVRIDTDLLKAALAINQDIDDLLEQKLIDISGVANVNSKQQCQAWINGNEGYAITNSFKKEAIADLLKMDIKPNTREFLEIYKEKNRSSTTKYNAMAVCLGREERVRGTMQFYGASRTGREAGRFIQVQNLPRTYIKDQDSAKRVIKSGDMTQVQLAYGDVKDTLSQMIRTAIIPAQGKVFMDADFSAIEARVLAWLAKEEWVLEVFRTHGKIYEANAARMFKVPIETIVKGHDNYHLRSSGKVAQLALGYAGGVNAIDAMDFNNDIPHDQRPDIVNRWRKENPNIVRFWANVNGAAIDTVQNLRTNSVNGLVFRMEAGIHGHRFLTIELPSGRKLYYYNATYESRPNPYDGSYKTAIYYEGVQSGKFVPISTYGGKLVENITQAVARDLLFNSLKNLEAAGYEVVMHIHDEVIVERDENDADLEAMYALMKQLPSWAVNFPLDSDGWKGYYFTKD